MDKEFCKIEILKAFRWPNDPLPDWFTKQCQHEVTTVFGNRKLRFRDQRGVEYIIPEGEWVSINNATVIATHEGEHFQFSYAPLVGDVKDKLFAARNDSILRQIKRDLSEVSKQEIAEFVTKCKAANIDSKFYILYAQIAGRLNDAPHIGVADSWEW